MKKFKDFRKFLEFLTGKEVKDWEIRSFDVVHEVKIFYEDGGHDTITIRHLEFLS